MFTEASMSNMWNLDYGELKNDGDFVDKCDNLADNLKRVQTVLEKLLKLKASASYEEQSPDYKIELELFLLYLLNSLHWMDLRLQGINDKNHPINRELERVKAAMVRWKEVKDRDLRPKVNVEAAKRFIRSGLYDQTPPNKKIKFE